MQETIVKPDACPVDLGGVCGLAGLAALSAAMSGCGGGGGGDAAAAVDSGGTASRTSAVAGAGAGAAAGADSANAAVTPPVRPPERISGEQASRFLSQAAFGGTAADITQVQTLGYEGWLSQQFGLPLSTSYLKLISTNGLDFDTRFDDSRLGIERAVWRKLISSPDLLRQRVTLALSEIFVISITPVFTPKRGFACAAFMDILEGNALGNYRDILMKVSTSLAMGVYLTFVNNVKANPITGSQPDENYARECMQLFTIGLQQLKLDGTPVLKDGAPIDSYVQADVLGLARVFTGWARSSTPDLVISAGEPMRMVATKHETGIKEFLGTKILENTDGETSLKLAVDTLMAHPNIGPFIGRQLIQRLVKSNPSPAYVARVATAFNGSSPATKGDMKATLRAVLLDAEARSSTGLSDEKHGKLREPMLRFIQWARTFDLKPAAGASYLIGDLSNPGKALGQSPLRATSVFNFFRPGYVPPNSALGNQGITAPEFQITNESTVASYLNFMQRVITSGIATMKPNYGNLADFVPDSKALVDKLNVWLAAGQLSATTVALLKTALDSIDASTEAGKTSRIQAALILVMAAPEYLVQK
jgi:uncharacterized protein (DUF1800 family)